jgi:hypothetical protein
VLTDNKSRSFVSERSARDLEVICVFLLRSGHAATLTTNKAGEPVLAVLGGYDSSGLLPGGDSLWLYDPKANKWTQITDPTNPRSVS